MWVEYNPNPVGRFVGDCAVRALTAALQMDWDDVHELLSYNARMMGDMPNADSVWGATLRQNGFRRKAISNSCPVPTTPVYGRTPIFTCGGNACGCNTGCGCGM